MADDPVRTTTEAQLLQAREALDDAIGARAAGLSDSVIINRLYYACFHAARAVLYDRNLNPSSHGGVLSLFGSDVVAIGDAPRENGRFLNRLSELRKQADYGYGEIDENLGVLCDRTEEFVSLAESLVSEDAN